MAFYSFGGGILEFEPAGLGIGTWFVGYVLLWGPGFWFGTVGWFDGLFGEGDGGFDCCEELAPEGF